MIQAGKTYPPSRKKTVVPRKNKRQIDVKLIIPTTDQCYIEKFLIHYMFNQMITGP